MELVNIIKEFGFNSIEPVKIGSGHINETFLVSEENGEKAILQKINIRVFKKPELLMSNLSLILNQLQASDYPYQIIKIILAGSGKPYIHDSSGFWRMISFLQGNEASVGPDNPKKAEIVAEGYGNFLKFVNTLDPGILDETITGFHDPENRYQQLLKSVELAPKKRLEEARVLTDHALDFSHLTLQYSKCCEQLPRRITHGDTKASNILVDSSGYNVVGVIDLDTVMSGFIMNDFGDMVRSMCNTGTEDDNDIEGIRLDLKNFRGISFGFLKTFGDQMIQEELDSLLVGVKSILFEQFLRFLTDFFQKDIYYDIKYPHQNLNRAKVHLKLLIDFQKKEEEFNGILNEYWGQI